MCYDYFRALKAIHTLCEMEEKGSGRIDRALSCAMPL